MGGSIAQSLTVTVNFDEDAISEISWTQNNSVGSSGTISSSGEEMNIGYSGYSGESDCIYYFEVTLNSGYEISSVTLGGTAVDLTSENTFTIDTGDYGSSELSYLTITTKSSEAWGGGFHDKR